MQYQRVTKRTPTGKGPPCPAETKNAAPAGSRNGANQKGSGKRTEAKNTATHPALASRLVALIARDGTVAGLFRRPDDVRAFLQGGRA